MVAATALEVFDDTRLAVLKDLLIQKQGAAPRKDISSFLAAFLNVYPWVNLPSFSRVLMHGKSVYFCFSEWLSRCLCRPCKHYLSVRLQVNWDDCGVVSTSPRVVIPPGQGHRTCPHYHKQNNLSLLKDSHIQFFACFSQSQHDTVSLNRLIVV